MTDSSRRPGRAGSSGGPASSRTGRRDRPRPVYREPSFLERHRSKLVVGGAAVVLVAAAVFVFLGATAKTYACTNIVSPVPQASAAPGATPEIGQTEPDMGRNHITAGTFQRYTYCPPASGFHINSLNLGPIQPRYYGPDDSTEPQGWLHNLEHGALVILYNCTGGCPDDASLQKLADFASPTTFPASPICHIAAGVVGPVVARFDDMATKYAAILWDRILLLDTPDTDQMRAFFLSYGDTTEPEPQPQCQATPSPEPTPEATPAPSESPSQSPAESPSSSGSPSSAPSPSASASPS